MYRVWLSVLFYWLIQQGVDATLTPGGSTVSMDCGAQQTFTCSVTGLSAVWTITLDGIGASGSNAFTFAASNNRVTTTDANGLVKTSTITITGFTTADDGGTVECRNAADGMVQGMTTVSVGVPSCSTNVRVTDRSSDFSSATITWDQPTNSPTVTSYDVTCNSSCTAMPCSSGSSTCRVLSVSPCEDYSVTVLPMNNCGSSTGCTENVVAVPSQGPPQCRFPQVVRQPDETGNNSCPYFTYTPPQGSPLPLTVMVSYYPQGDSSLTRSLNCSYPIVPQMCNLNVTGGIYMVTLTPVNNCGSPSCDSQTEDIPAHCSLAVTATFSSTSSLPPDVFAGIVIGGAAAVVAAGVTGYFITILIMSCTCFASIGFLPLLKCQCCKGSAMKSSSKQRMRSESPVTPPAQPPAQPPADEYANPQAIRDRKERGKEDKDKIQYAAIDFSAGAGSGAGEVKIHQKEEPVIYTAVQHV